MKILIAGDLSGRASRGISEPDSISKRRLMRVDIDEFDSVFATLSPQIQVPLGLSGESVAIEFRSLDDFHPDSLWDRLTIFESLRGSRRRIADPAKFEQEAARWTLPKSPQPTSDTAKHVAASPTSISKSPADLSDFATPASNADLLSQLISGSPEAVVVPSRPAIQVGGVNLDRLVDEIVAPFVLPKANPRQAEYVAAIDSAAAETLKSILHAVEFQCVERAWRQLWRVVKAITATNEIEVYLLDVTRAELEADLTAIPKDLTRSGISKLLFDRQVDRAGGQPWNWLVFLESFGPADQDCVLLEALGALATRCGGSLLADASPSLLGSKRWTEATEQDNWQAEPTMNSRWRALRAGMNSGSIGLAAPRPLVRLPYGKDNRLERLEFEEVSGRSDHDAFLWGSAALAVCERIGCAYLDGGTGTIAGDLEELPPCILKEDGETTLLPSAEVFLTTTLAEQFVARGLIPLMSYANRHAARIPSLVSVAYPTRRLQGTSQG